MDIDGIYYCSRCMRKVEDDTQVCPHCGYDPSGVTINSQYLAEGTFLNDRYLLGAVIGAGGFGVTYAAWDENLSVPVAIKEYFPVKYAHRNIEESDELLPHEESRGLFALGLSRFRKEAQVLAQFQNVPGIVNINECFDENETAYIAMEFVHGVPLDEYVQEHKPSPKKLLDIMLPAINALEIIHRQGINHRDIKPDNLLVQEDGSIKLIDFGSAREVEHVTDMIVVSDGYAPLEQYDLKQPQGPWVDVYGISATIYHMLTGVMPEASISRAKNDTLKAPSKLGVKLKKYQEKALMAGLAVDPQKRIQSIAEFRALLYNIPLPEEVRRRKAFVRRVIAVAVLTVLLMAATVVNFAVGFPLGEGLLYSLYPDGWHIVGTLREVADVDVPNTRLGIPISAISRETFRHNSTLDSILVPSNVREIGPYAFADCKSLSMVTLSEGVKVIHSFAFSDCPSLHTIYLPDSIQQLDSTAFEEHGDFLTVWGNTALNHLLPEGVNLADRVAYTVTENTTGLTLASCILLPSQSDVVLPSYIDGRPITHVSENALGETIPEWVSSITFPYYMDTIYSWSGGSVVKRGIEMVYGAEIVTIASHAFEHATFTSFEFPPKLKEIGDSAFAYSSLVEVRLPDSVQNIGVKAFAYSTDLRSVTLSSNMKTLETGLFLNCGSLLNVVIPEGIENISNFCFDGCYSLRNIWLPESLTCIAPMEALPISVRYLYLPSGINPFDLAFTLASGSTQVIAGTTYEIMHFSSTINAYFDNPDDWNVFPDPENPGVIFIDVGTIENAVCAGFDTLHNVPVTEVYTFCSTETPILRSVQLPPTVQVIGGNAFTDCTELEEINFPNSLTEICGGAFSNTGLTSISLPDSVSYLGNDTFCNNSKLESVRLSSAKLYQSFNNCPSLKSVWCETGSITGCFDNCESLTEIVISTYIDSVISSFENTPHVTVYHKGSLYSTFSGFANHNTHDAKFFQITDDDLLTYCAYGSFPEDVTERSQSIFNLYSD